MKNDKIEKLKFNFIGILKNAQNFFNLNCFVLVEVLGNFTAIQINFCN